MARILPPPSRTILRASAPRWPPFLFDDRRRWVKFVAAVALMAGLCLASGIVVPLIRPSVLRFETRADEFDGRFFSLDYRRVETTHAAYFTVHTTYRGTLLFTDEAHLSVPGGLEGALVAESVRICGVTARVGDSVSAAGRFRKPNLFVLTEVRLHPRRTLKYAAGVPAFLAALAAAWLGLRRTPTGLGLRIPFGRERR